MAESSQPRKKRKLLYSAPLHVKGKMLAGHLSKELRKELKKRSDRIHKGDTVKILWGKFRGVSGKVLTVSLRDVAITVEGAVVKKVGGKELPASIDPSNVVITQRVERK